MIKPTHYLIAGHRHWTKDTSAETALLKWIEAARPTTAAQVECFYVDADARVDAHGGLTAKALYQLPNVTVPMALVDMVYQLADTLCDTTDPLTEAAGDIDWEPAPNGAIEL